MIRIDLRSNTKNFPQMETDNPPRCPVSKQLIAKCVRNRDLEQVIERWVNDQVTQHFATTPVRSQTDAKTSLLPHGFLNKRGSVKEIEFINSKVTEENNPKPSPLTPSNS